MLINTLLIGGMAIVFLLIIGVFGALVSSRKYAVSAALRTDRVEIDLENRLQNLGIGTATSGQRKDTSARVCP